MLSRFFLLVCFHREMLRIEPIGSVEVLGV